MTTPRKVVLYNPRAVFYTMPLALVALGSALDRRRFEPVIVDARLEEDPRARLIEEARGAVAVGITVLTGAPLADALAATRALAAACPGLPVIWGGWHPSLFAAECLAEPGVAVAVVGQGEATFAELLDRLTAGDSLAGCLGIAHRQPGGGIAVEPPRPLRPLDEFPPHDFGLIPVERYLSLKGRRQIDYVASQGCPYRCTFCADPQVYRRRWVGLAPERIADELAELATRYAIAEVAFQDETFFVYPDRVEQLAQRWLDRGVRLSWTATLRADQGARMDDATFALARRAGFSRAMVGVEAGAQEQLDWMSKDARVEQVIITAERLLRHDIGAIFNFIVGFPDEPKESIEATLALLKRLRAMSSRFETPVFYYRPYPGTPIAEGARRAGHRFPETLDGWADFDYVASRGPWVSEELFRRVERLKFYARHAWGPTTPLRWPLAAISRWRCRHDRYGFPVEQRLVEALRPGPKLA